VCRTFRFIVSVVGLLSKYYIQKGRRKVILNVTSTVGVKSERIPDLGC